MARRDYVSLSSEAAGCEPHFLSARVRGSGQRLHRHGERTRQATARSHQQAKAESHRQTNHRSHRRQCLTAKAWEHLRKQVRAPVPLGPAIVETRKYIIEQLKTSGIEAKEQPFIGMTPLGEVDGERDRHDTRPAS